MLPSALWKGMGADVPQLLAIMRVKLLQDDRKPLPFGRQRQKKDRKGGAVMNVFFSALMGCIYLYPLFLVSDVIISLAIYFAFFLFVLTFMLITDFSNVLFDTKDKYIILPRPVNDQTLFLSRILHVFIYLFRIVLPMALPGWIVIGIKMGWQSALLFPVILMLMIFMVMFLVNGCYLLVLRFAKPEKFKNVISYFQIFFSIMFFVVTYFTPRLMNSAIFTKIEPANFMWARYLPSYWLATCWTWIGYELILPGTAWLSILAVALPVVLVFVTVKWLAPRFGKEIGAIDVGETAPKGISTKRGNSGFYKKLANILNSSYAAQAGFVITWIQTSRNRAFKMRVYPMFVYAPVMFIYMLTSGRSGSFSERWSDLAESNYYLFLLYLCVMSIMQALNYLNFSDQYKAAWVYYASPLEKPGRVMAGAFKAAWVKYFLPLFLIISIFVLYKWGAHVLLDIILAVTNMTLFAVIMVRISFRNFPFSQMEQLKNSGGRVIKSLLTLAIPGLLGFGHYLAINLWWLKLILLGLSGVLLWLVWDSYANTSWDDMKKEELL
jgi:hypothetical protein